jgi:PAS domain S-box-containing protein
MKNKFWKSPLLVLLAAAIFLIFFIYISVRLSQQVKTINEKVSNTRSMQLQLQSVQNAILYNENNARLYVVNPSSDLDEVLIQVPVLIRQEINKLKPFALEEPAELKTIDTISFYAEKRIELSNKLVAARKDRGMDGAIALMQSPEGAFYMSKTRELFNKLEQSENIELQTELAVRQDSINKFSFLLLSIFLFIIIFGVLFLMQLIKNNNQKSREIENMKYVDLILDNISDAVITTDADFKIRSWNKAAEIMYGFNSAAVMGKDIADAVHSKVPEDTIMGIRQEMRTKGVWKGEVTHLNAEKREIVVQSSRSAIINNEGKLTGYVSSNRDITESKIAENLLSKFNQELSHQVKEKTIELTNVFDRITDSFVAFDNNWNYTFINRKAQQLLGKTSDQLLNNNVWEIFPDDINQPFYNALHEAKQTQKPAHLELYYEPLERWYEDFIFPSPSGISVYYHDITEKKKAEIALKENEDKYRTLIEQASDGIFITDENGNYVEVNNSGCEMLGYSKEELKKLTIRDMVIMDEDFVPFRFAELNEGKSVIQPRKLKRKDGSVLQAEISAKKLPDGKLLGFVRDMTDRIESDKKLQIEKELSDKIINSLPGLFYLSDPSPRLVRWNKEFEKISGYSAEELSKIIPITLFESADHDLVRQSIDKTYREGLASVDARLLTKNGDKVPYYFTGVRVEYEGKPAMLGTGIDMSERKKAEEEKSRLLNTIQKSLDEIYMFNPENFHFEYANDGALLNLGYTIEEMYQLTPLNIKPEMTLEKVQKLVAPLLNKEKEKIVFETTHKRKDNSIYPVEVHLQLIEQGDKKIFLTIARDITERKKSEEEIRKSNERFELIGKATNDALWEINLDTNEKWGNDSFYQLYNLNKQTDNLNHLTLYSRTHPDDVDRLKSILETAINKKDQSFVAEYRFKIAENNYRTFLDRAFIKYDEKGRPVKLIGAMLDITERKKTEEKINIANERFELIGKATNDALWEWNLETNEIWGNEAHQKLYGLTIADPVPEDPDWRKRLHPDDRDRVIKTVDDALVSDATGIDMEYRFLSDEKKWIYIYGSNYIERNKDGKAIRMLGNMTDITSRKKNEQHLKLLESVITNTNDAILITEAEPFNEHGPKIIYVNPAFTKMTGYTAEEVIGKTPRMLQGPKTDKREMKRLKDAMKKWEPCEVTTINYKKNGEEFWINFSISPVANEKGWFTHWISIDKDVTERKKEEQLLKDNEERLRLSLKAANQGLFDLNVQTGEAIVNDQYALMLGYDPATFKETNAYWIERLHPDDAAGTAKAYQDYIQGKTEDYKVEFRQKTKDNKWIWILSIGKIVEYGNDGSPLRMMGTHTEITARKLAEESLQKTEKRLQFLLSATPAVIYSSKAEFPFGALFISENIFEQSGYRPAEFINDVDFWQEHLHPEDRPRILKGLKHVFEKGFHTHEYRFRKKDGRYIWMHDEMKLVYDSSGKPIEIVGYWINIDERKKAENALSASENQLRTIYETEPECIKILNNKGELLEMNPAGLAMIEADNLEKVKGKKVLGIIDENYRKDFDKLTNDVFQGKSGKLAFLIIGLKGTKRWLETHAVPMRDMEGNITSLLGVTRDITDRKKAEEELIYNELRFRTLTSNAPVAIFQTDVNGKTTYVNDTWMNYAGLTFEESLGDKWLDAVYPDDQNIVMKNWTERSKKGIQSEAEYRLVDKKGKIRWMSGRSTPLFNLNNEVIGHIGTLTDITSMKEAEIDILKTQEKLKQSEAKYRSLVDQAGDAIALFDEKGKVLEANDSASQLLGYSISELMNLSLPEILTQEDLKKNPVQFNLLKKGVTTIKQRKMKKKDGAVVETEVNSKILPDGRFLAIIRDLSERIGIQKQIEKEKDLSNKIIDSLPGIFYLLDCTSSKIIRWNKRVETITGYSSEEIDTIPYLDFIDESDRKNLSEKLMEVLINGNSEAEVNIRTKDGRRIAYYFTGWLVNLEGNPFIIGNALDISARKKAEQELDESYKSIRKLTSYLQNIREEERTNIAREIHDELGQLLTVMKMDVSWLNKKIGTDAEVPVKNKMKDLLDMIDGTVKTVRRISSELRPSLLDDLGLVAAIEWHLIEFEKRVGIKTSFTDAADEVVLPDKVKTGIFRIFQESLTNVARHAEASKITVKMECKNNMFLLKISDNGIGFDKTKVADKRTLGILGMKERSEMMGGIYDIVSTPGKGTTILVKVPLSETVQNLN